MTVKELLIAARAVIEDPANWCQGSYALDSTPHNVEPNDPNAVRFCALGALKRVSPERDTGRHGLPIYRWVDDEVDEAHRILMDAAEELYFADVVELNDFMPGIGESQHPKVLEMYDLAISAAV